MDLTQTGLSWLHEAETIDKTIARDNRDGHVETEYEPGREGFEVSGIRLGLTDDDLDDEVHAQQRDGRRSEKGFKNKLS